MIARCSRALITSLCLACCVASTERVAAGRSGQQQVNVENIHVHRENERRPETSPSPPVSETSLSPPVSETPETAQGTVRNETTANATKHPGSVYGWSWNILLHWKLSLAVMWQRYATTMEDSVCARARVCVCECVRACVLVWACVFVHVGCLFSALRRFS